MVNGGFIDDSGAFRSECFGVLITSRHVLAAASCKNRIEKVQLGPRGLQIDIVKKTQHPDFEKDRIDFDVAVWELESSVAINDKIRPICLPSEANSDVDSKIGEFLSVSGFNKSELLTDTNIVISSNR